MNDFREFEGNTIAVLAHQGLVAHGDAVPKPSLQLLPSSPGSIQDAALDRTSTNGGAGTPNVILLNRHGVTPAIEAIAAELRLHITDRGISHMSLGDDSSFPENSFFISLIELDESLLATITEAEFSRLQQLVLTRTESQILWVTSGAHLSASKPELSLINGFARAMRNELASFRFNIVDISTECIERRALYIYRVFKACSSRPADLQNLQELDWEFCESNGIIHVPRLVIDNKTRAKYSIQKDRHQPMLEPFRQEKKNLGLVCTQRGLLSSLIFKDVGTAEVLEEDSVEVRCEAWGLNFKVGYIYPAS